MATISRRRLEWLVRSRGTDLTIWPEADRVAAVALLRRSPEAQSVFADALARDEEVIEPEAAAVFERMQAALRRRLAPLSMTWRCACAAALIACLAAGLHFAADASDTDAVADLFSTAQTVNLAALD